jgi:hypothetical protein
MITIQTILASMSLGEVRAEVHADINGEAKVFSDVPLTGDAATYEDQAVAFINEQPA